MKKILLVFFLLNINLLYSDSVLNPDYFFISLGDKNDSHPNKFNTYVSCNRGGDDIEFEDGSLPTCQNQDNSSLSIGIGYDLNETTSFEFSYYDLGNSESYFSTEEFYCYPSCAFTSSGFYYDYSSLQANTIHNIELKNNLSLYTKIGLSYLDISLKGKGLFDNEEPDSNDYLDSSFELILGVGATYQFNGKHRVYLEFIDMGHSSQESFFSIGYKINFNE